MEVVIHKSNSGSIKYIDIIYFDVINPKSYAAFILLKDYYRKLDEDYLKPYQERMKRIQFSRDFLTKKQEELGTLSCAYCPKTDLVIEYEGMRVQNKMKATIDHVVPISKGGPIYDENNIVVCCGTCNNKKDDKSVEQFLATRK